MGSIGAAAFATALILAVTASLALAAEVSRTEYKEAVEPICHANAKANERILSSVRTEVKQGKLKLAASHFAKAASALGKTYKQLKAVPQPSADETELGKWLSDVNGEVELLQKISKALKQGKRAKAERYVAALTRNAERANATVLDFEFRYCRFQPSKYT
ncbi:MAG: hypothetical protein ACTHK6_02650 [Solirubrobacterales bacterium]